MIHKHKVNVAMLHCLSIVKSTPPLLRKGDPATSYGKVRVRRWQDSAVPIACNPFELFCSFRTGVYPILGNLFSSYTSNSPRTDRRGIYRTYSRASTFLSSRFLSPVVSSHWRSEIRLRTKRGILFGPPLALRINAQPRRHIQDLLAILR